MKLYKYVTRERIDILINGMIRFTQPSDFNDPTEVNPYFERVIEDPELRKDMEVEVPKLIFKETLKSEYDKLPEEVRNNLSYDFIEKKLNENPELLEYSIKQGIDYAVNFQRAFMPTIRTLTKDWLSNKYIGILSLSEEKNNNLMWSHYTGNHEGFVLEFDSSNNFFHQPINNDIGELRKVIYESEKPVFNSMKNVNSDFVFYIKWKEWQYENEWRLILPLINAEKPILINAKEIYLFKIPPECITGIIIGSRSPFNLKEDIKKLIKTDNRYYHLSYYEAKYHDKGYDLLIEKIDL